MPSWGYFNQTEEQVAAYNEWMAQVYYCMETEPKAVPTTLRDKPIAEFFTLDGCKDVRPGRRMRAAMMLKDTVHAPPGTVTYGEYYDYLIAERPNGASNLSLQAHRADGPRWVTEIGEFSSNADPELHRCLMDLAYEINEDIREACFAFNDPSLYYPGVDEGIAPVTDDHVRLVMWALQRELRRELRSSKDNTLKLPAVPLDELPWNVQRALAERRRLRFAQFGIGREQWLANQWSIFSIPEDPDWVPRRALRLAATQ